jgi:hypothetical protein
LLLAASVGTESSAASVFFALSFLLSSRNLFTKQRLLCKTVEHKKALEEIIIIQSNLSFELSEDVFYLIFKKFSVDFFCLSGFFLKRQTLEKLCREKRIIQTHEGQTESKGANGWAKRRNDSQTKGFSPDKGLGKNICIQKVGG